ncbi:Putative 1,4-Dihydroxy-2-naphtoate prenyltransferase (part3) [Mycobacterium tuberculosis CAS/NITR204]|uniref:1,4-Dihydroxy-2-naphtoate prenyltransferase (Part3) n=2 Tax=Mycobacterium tuberculosis TaxID=1773 RepID=A0A654T895_MYCTX|nr:Putative 1,4-Dihydroxy-2-naphtoate prenyltransferase (part3) [Mycobacterium tuberculosis CAS/NITR204]CFE39289.1 Putative 1%2C4-Dihydroxy-2-naphtoate prenyltransferase (part3) [Mycobacterium tuberculosis]
MGAGGWEVVLASLPYGLLCTTVLMGKHIDKIGYDEPLGIRTLPVLLGETCARTVTLAMMVGFYLLIAVNVMLAAMPRVAGRRGAAPAGESVALFPATAAPAAATGVSGVAAVVCRVGLAARASGRCAAGCGPGDRCLAARLVIFADGCDSWSWRRLRLGRLSAASMQGMHRG